MATDQITAIEDAIIERLKRLPLQAGVLPYPDKDFEKYEPMHGNGEILVSYVGEDEGAATGLDLLVQEREIQFELTFVFSSLRAVGRNGGLYAHLEAARLALTGWRAPDCHKKTILVSVDRVRRYKQRWWQYVQAWQFTALNIEIPDEEQYPLLKRITAHDNLGNTTEVP